MARGRKKKVVDDVNVSEEPQLPITEDENIPEQAQNVELVNEEKPMMPEKKAELPEDYKGKGKQYPGCFKKVVNERELAKLTSEGKVYGYIVATKEAIIKKEH